MKRILKLSFVLVCALALSLCLMTAARADAVYTIKETVNASECPSGDIVLTGDTTLVMDKDLTLRSIRGDFSLTVLDNGGHTLTVSTPLDPNVITANGKGHGISVKSFTCDAALKITARKDGLNIDGDINFTGPSLTVFSKSGDAVYSRNGSIYLAGVCDIRAGDCPVRSVKGGVFFDGSYLSAISDSSYNYAIVGQSVDLRGGVIIAASGANCIVANGNEGMYLQGDVTASSQVDYGSVLNARRGDMVIGAGSSVTVVGGGYGIYTTGGLLIGGSTVDITAKSKDGICVYAGNFNAEGSDIKITAPTSCVYVRSGDVTFNGTSLDAETSKKDYYCFLCSGSASFNYGCDIKLVSPSGAIVARGEKLFIDCPFKSGTTDDDSCVALSCPNGDLDIRSHADVTAISAGQAVCAKELHVLGPLYARAYKHEAVVTEEFVVQEAKLTAISPKTALLVTGYGGCAILHGGQLDLQTTDDKDAYALKTEKADVYWNDRAVTVKIRSVGGGIWSAKSVQTHVMNPNGIKFDIESESLPCIHAQNGKFVLRNADLDLYCAGTNVAAIYAPSAVTLGNCVSNITSPNNVGILSYGDITVSGGELNVESKYNALSTNNNNVIFENGAAASVNSSNLYAIYAYRVTVGEGCDVTAETNGDGSDRYEGAAIVAYCGTVFVNGKLRATSPEGVQKPIRTPSGGGIVLGENVRVTKPAAGYVSRYESNHMYTDRVGSMKNSANEVKIPTNDVEFDSIPIEGTVTLDTYVAKPGDLIRDASNITNDPEPYQYSRWERSANREEWETVLENRYNYTVKAGDKGYYIRCVITDLSRCGELYSEPCFVPLTDVLSGGIVYTSAVRYTNPLSSAQTARTGLLAQLEKSDPSKVHFRWQRSANADYGWTDIPKSESAAAVTSTYKPGSNDVGNYIRLTATADGYTGVVCASPKYVGKLAGAVLPDNPATLSCPSPFDAIYVTNAKATQEYICSKSSQAPADWSLSFKPSSNGSFGFQCEPDTFYYVHTRNKATAQREASGSMYTSIYTGNTTYLQGFKLSRTSYTTKVGDSAVQISVSPLPDTTTGWSDMTVHWFVNGGGVKLYTDKECTLQVSTTPGQNTLVKTVYAKAVNQAEGVQIGVEKTVGYNDVKVALCSVNVADADGDFILHGVSFETLTINPGETATATYKSNPSRAKVGALTFKKNDGVMPESELTITDNDDFAYNESTKTGSGTVTVTAPEDCIEGEYYYKVTIADAPASSGYLSFIKVVVALPEATVSFDDGSGELYGADLRTASAGGLRKGMDAQKVPLGSEFILPENEFYVPEGWEFDGWDVGDAGDGINVTEDVTVTAKWKQHVHNMVYEPAIPNTCTTVGRMELWYCTECGGTYGDEYGTNNYAEHPEFLMIPASGHNAGEPSRENEVAPTCADEGGYDTVVRCTVCGEVISSEHTTLEAAGHTPGEPVREYEFFASCTGGGGYDLVTYCTVCGEELSREFVATPVAGHTLEPVAAHEPTCTDEGNSAYYFCVYCGAFFEDADGLHGIESNEALYTDPLGHDCGAATYVWAQDNSACTATAVCTRGHEVTETVETGYEVILEPGTDHDGLGKYSASFENGCFEGQEKEVTIPALTGDTPYISASVNGNDLTFAIDNAPAEFYVYAARYDNGKLTHVYKATDALSATAPMGGTGAKYKIFVTDYNGKPLCACWHN
ncbi:MAG: hypothetical protein IJS65_06310 [Clostridia bacterium]|nr:hypothetical protein [Clostridia bacterium]